MTPYNFEISDDGFDTVYDVNNPTQQTERLSYMLANMLDGMSGTIALPSEGEVTARDDALNAIVTLLNEGIDDGELEYFAPPVAGVWSKLFEAASSQTELPAVSFELAGIREMLDKMSVIRDEEGEIVGLVADKVVDAIQDVAASAGLTLDAYGDIIAVQRETPEEP